MQKCYYVNFAIIITLPINIMSLSFWFYLLIKYTRVHS